jgi:tetrahydromethanopterin S-methyltransferase subunit G
MRRKSMSRRSFRATKDQYDELPNDKEKLTRIMVAKNKHLKKMQKMLDEAENDAIESDMISDPDELRKMLAKLVDRNNELEKEVKRMPQRIGKMSLINRTKAKGL